MMKKKLVFTLVLALAFLLAFSSCAPAYRGDARVGSYVAYGADGKTVVYRLTLEENGKGVIIHYPAIGGETREDVFFEFRDTTLNVHGTEVVGGVIGRSEVWGEVALISDAYTFELRSAGGVLANFVKE